MGRKRGLPTLTLLACLGFATLILAQPIGMDPVERLRQALRTVDTEPAERFRVVQARLAALRSPVELRRAYYLLDWRERSADAALAEVDGANRALVRDRFFQTVHELVQRGDALQAAAAVDQVTEWARDARARNQPIPLAGSFTLDAVCLLQDGAPPVRAAAARALGQVDPPPEIALPPLAALFNSREPPARLAVVDALDGLLQAALLPLAGNNASALRPAVRRAVAAKVTGVARLLRVGLGDWHPQVRCRCAACAAGAAAALGQLIGEPLNPTDGAPANDVGELRELALALHDLGAPLAAMLGDREASVRLASQKALEELAVARVAWLKAGAPDDPLLVGLQAAVPGLAEKTADPDVRVRRAALDVLEWLGPAASATLPALVRALSDGDRFVRWSAVRALNSLGPQTSRSAAGSLARLLEDPDLDIRLAAAAALERLDPQQAVVPAQFVVDGASSRISPQARAALPNLLRALKGSDPALRLATLRTVRGLGADARPAVPALRELLHDPSAHVRVAAAEVLGELGPLARDATEDLRVAVADGDADVRRAAGEALLSILRPNPP